MSALGWFALGTLGFAYVGYPAWLAATTRGADGNHRPDPGYLPKVSVLVPAFDAEALVGPKLESLLAQDYPPGRLEIVVYSDGSTDRTVEEAKRYEARGVRVLASEARRGKPTALNTMRGHAHGEVVVLTDVRQPLSRSAIRALVGHLADPDVGCVSGRLVLEGEQGAGIYWAYETFLREREARRRTMLGATGPLYALRREDLPIVPEDTLLDDMWIPMRLVLDGRRAVFEPSAEARDRAFDDGRERSRKVRTIAGNYQLLERMPELLDPRKNPAFLEYMAHKVLRLASPPLFALLAVDATIASLSPRRSVGRAAARTVMAGLGAGVVAAIAGDRAGRIGRASRTFLVLQGAAVEGFARWAQGTQPVTW
jgi:hypothetical protein